MKTIAVVSGKGGAGKSCVAGYTGAALAMQGNKTLLLEAGNTVRSLDLLTGTQDEALFDLGDLLSGRCEPEKAIVASPLWQNLWLIPGVLFPEASRIAPLFSLKERLDGFLGGFDFLILDNPDVAVCALPAVDRVLLVTEPDSLSVRACAQKAGLLRDAGVQSLRLVINNVPAQVLPIYGMRDFDDIIDQTGVQLIAVIPQSPKLKACANNAKPLDPLSLTVEVFDNLAARLQGQNRPLLIQ